MLKKGNVWKHGYVMVKSPKHPRANPDGFVPEQYLVAEAILGKTLPLPVVIHHVNGNRADNTPSNLVICQDSSYHWLIHQREKAYRACGHANWRCCEYCHEYDDLQNMSIHKPNLGHYHKHCSAAYQRKRRQLKKGNYSWLN